MLSPSITSPGQAGPAYEIKFLLTEAEAEDVEAWATEHLIRDSHGDAALGGAYETTSLYTDTPAFDVYHRTRGNRRRKYRARRYGTGPEVYLERKIRRGDRVAKRREVIPLDDLSLMAGPLCLATWPGHWFQQRLIARGLVPVCRIGYRRTAFLGATSGGSVRLTMDRSVRGVPLSDWNMEPQAGWRPLLEGHVILELKFRRAMPTLFKRLVQSLALLPTGVSKYRHCLEAWNLQNSRVSLGTPEERYA